MGRNSSKVNRVARQLIVELHMSVSDLECGPTGPTGAALLWSSHSELVRAKLKKMCPGTLGEIIACGRGWGDRGASTSMYEVQQGHLGRIYESGKQILLTLATTAIIAEMTDILTFRKQQARVAGQQTGYHTFLYQQDAPTCSDCGATMVRNGACYKCLNCGATSGCP